MSYDPKTRLHRCDACRRPQNSPVVLSEVRKTGESKPMNICGARGCWDQANERGYFGAAQDRPASSD